MDTIHQASVDASHRIAYVTVTISNGDGILQKCTAYAKESSYRQLFMSAFFDPLEEPVLQGKIDPDSLPAGTYHCTITCRLATGNTYTAHEFDFTK